jgi:hypothetical protein
MLPCKPRPFLWLFLAGLLLAIAVIFLSLQPQPPLLVQSLRSLPEVRSVEYQGPKEADLVVIHLRDWHYVPKELCEPDGIDFESNLAAVDVGIDTISPVMTGITDERALQYRQNEGIG